MKPVGTVSVPVALDVDLSPLERAQKTITQLAEAFSVLKPKRRPIYVSQRENDRGDFWYTVRGGNGENVLTSKMYAERWRAVRAARAFIESVAPAPVHFAWYSGPYPRAVRCGYDRGTVRYHSERIR